MSDKTLPEQTAEPRQHYTVTLPETFVWAQRELTIPAPHTADEIATVIHAELESVGYAGIGVNVLLSTGTVRVTWNVGVPLYGTITGPGVGGQPDELAKLVAGLRALADFYENNPTMPVPSYPRLLVSCSNIAADDDAAAELVRHAAGLLGVEANESDAGGWDADGRFGPLTLAVYSTTEARMAQWDAERSYRGSVQPERSAS